MYRLLALLFVLGFSAAAQAQTVESRLSIEDERIVGKFYETYPIELSVGDVVKVTLTSNDFDTFVYVKSPAEQWVNNDDCTEGDTTKSCLTMTAEENGVYEVWASTYERGDYGDYKIEIVINP